MLLAVVHSYDYDYVDYVFFLVPRTPSDTRIAYIIISIRKWSITSYDYNIGNVKVP